MVYIYLYICIYGLVCGRVIEDDFSQFNWILCYRTATKVVRFCSFLDRNLVCLIKNTQYIKWNWPKNLQSVLRNITIVTWIRVIFSLPTINEIFICYFWRSKIVSSLVAQVS